MTLVGLWAAPYLMHVHGMAPIEAGSYTAITLIAFACSVPVVGWWSDRAADRAAPDYARLQHRVFCSAA